MHVLCYGFGSSQFVLTAVIYWLFFFLPLYHACVYAIFNEPCEVKVYADVHALMTGIVLCAFSASGRERLTVFRWFSLFTLDIKCL